MLIVVFVVLRSPIFLNPFIYFLFEPFYFLSLYITEKYFFYVTLFFARYLAFFV